MQRLYVITTTHGDSFEQFCSLSTVKVYLRHGWTVRLV